MTSEKYVTFRLSNEWYGINILLVREISQIAEITTVDHAPPYIKGIINLRGQLATIFDLNLCLDGKAPAAQEISNCIILKTAKELKNFKKLSHVAQTETIGLIVDSVGDILEISLSNIQNTITQTSGLEDRFIEGIVRQDNRLITLLNVSEILSPERTTLKTLS